MRPFFAFVALALISCADIASAEALKDQVKTACRLVPMEGTGVSIGAARPSWAMPLSRPAGSRSQRAIVYPQAAPSPQLYRYDCSPGYMEPDPAPYNGSDGQ
uniref:hypothetical protein n=1 Tax=Brucella pseudintermedia TaxID=370111 RepID=UPI000EFD3C8A|nr:hypothetical protein [Brucella pseudintermedia]